MQSDSKLVCQMTNNCGSPVTHIDSSGFVYCEMHGRQRRAYKRCRKLKPAEIKRLESGQPLTRYET